MRAFFAWVSLLGVFAVHGDSPPGSRGREQWQEFRARFPYHMQCIAVSEAKDDVRVVVLAEPPPTVTTADLERVLGVPVRVLSHPVGHDGCVRDAVAELPATAPDLDERLAQLAQLVYGTTYGAAALTLPAPAPKAAREDYDHSIRADELRSWVDTRQFEPVVGGPAATGVDLLREARAGVFRSVESGLVLWIVPKRDDLAIHRVDARQWALEADLVVGAVEGPEAVAIVGRERAIDVLELPPLRFETMLRLASVDEDEVAQSYERNHLFAGRYDDEHDWAPIYLSDALVDTEYGSLLNITDQLLKSWSLNGTVGYERFDQYPRPPFGWPPFEKPLMTLLEDQGVSQLTFNWNTQGVGYVQGEVGRRVLAIERTGALSVSYLPEGAAGDDDAAAPVPADMAGTYEDRGYQFFAASGDPNIARALQYALLFQVFRTFDIHGTDPTPRVAAGGWASAFQPAVVELLRKIADQDDDNADLVARLTAQSDSDEERELIASLSRWSLVNWYQALTAPIATLGPSFVDQLAGQIVRTQLGPEARARLSRISAKLDGAEDLDFAEVSRRLGRSDGAFYWSLVLAHEFRTDPFMQELAAGDASIRKAQKERYVAAVPARAAAWIRTPTIVVSSPDNLTMVGGHNIGAQTTRVVADATVARNTVSIAESAGVRTIRVHPTQQDAAHALIRGATRQADLAAAERWASARLRTFVPQPPRLPTAAMYHQALPRVPRPAHGTVLGEVRQSLTAADRTLIEACAEASPNGFSVTRTTTGFRLVGGQGGGQVVAMKARSALVDAIVERTIAQNRGHLRFDLFAPGLSRSELSALSESVRARLAARGGGTRPNLAVMGFADRMPVRSIGRLQERYAYPRAAVRIQSTRAVAAEQQVVLDIQVPAVTASAPSLTVRIHLRMKELAHGLVERVRALLHGRNATDNGWDTLRQLRRDLEEIDASQILFELDDLMIGRSEERLHERSTRRAA
ncbi:MAG: hypothetical protein AB7O97_06055 [Planctomycetota bacterium]